MPYTVQKLAKLSGVSIRTIHFYDEINLLKPAYTKANGYRYYEEKELLTLQQILFFRELGFELKKIQKILGKSDFDKVAALHSHRKVLQANVERTKKLIQTIAKTIDHLAGEKKMDDHELYHGFVTKEQQADYESYLKNRFGATNPTLAESKKNIKGFTKTDWEKSNKEFGTICKELLAMLENGLPVDSTKVQTVISQHYLWLKKFWIPTKQSYIGLGQTYVGYEWKKAFESHDPDHPRLAQYLADAMKVFADQKLVE